MTNFTQQLKPCPFCGSDNLKCSSADSWFNNHTIECHGCGAGGPWSSEEQDPDNEQGSQQEAMELWNTRIEE